MPLPQRPRPINVPRGDRVQGGTGRGLNRRAQRDGGDGAGAEEAPPHRLDRRRHGTAGRTGIPPAAAEAVAASMIATPRRESWAVTVIGLSLIHISEPTRLLSI